MEIELPLYEQLLPASQKKKKRIKKEKKKRASGGMENGAKEKMVGLFSFLQRDQTKGS